jgi:hypothetical protein
MVLPDRMHRSQPSTELAALVEGGAALAGLVVTAVLVVVALASAVSILLSL